MAILTLFLLQCTQIAGTSDETSTRSARILNPDLSPASGVKVQLFASGDSSLVPDTVVYTNNNGVCYFSVGKGYYNIWAERDSLNAFSDSLNKNSGEADTLVLKKNGSVSGIVRMQPGDDPRTVYIAVLGTYKYCNVDDEGRFTLNGLAQGDYTLRLVSTLADYTPTFKEISCVSDSSLELSDTIDMVYSGIPSVGNISTRFDSITGTAVISWEKSTYPLIDRYMVYRTSSVVPYAERVFIGTVSDTIFIDSGAYTLSPGAARYSVSILSRTGQEGRDYTSADIDLIEPRSLLNLLVPQSGTSIQKRDSVLFIWRKVPGAQNYQLLLTGDYYSRDTLALISTADTQVTLSSLSAGAHYWKIRAQSRSALYGPWSEVLNFGLGVLTMKLGEPGFYSGHTIMTGLQDGAIVLSSSNNGKNASVLMIDTVGQVTWEAPVIHPAGRELYGHGVLKTNGGVISSFCSYANGLADSSVLIKLSTTGNEVWRKNVKFVSNLQTSPEKGTIYAVHEREISTFDPSGELIEIYALPVDSVEMAVPSGDSTLVLGLNSMNSLQIKQLRLGGEVSTMQNSHSVIGSIPFAGWPESDGSAVLGFKENAGSFKFFNIGIDGAVNQIGSWSGSPVFWDKYHSTVAVFTVSYSDECRNVLNLFNENFSSSQMQMGKCVQNWGEKEYILSAKGCAVQGESNLMILVGISENHNQQTYLMRFPIGSRPYFPYPLVAD